MNELRRNDVEEQANAGLRKKPDVAVVILNWNGLDFLKKFLPFVVVSTYENKRIIVADNNSSDASVAYVREHFPNIEVIQNPENKGFAAGYNMALQKVKSDYYVLLNSDVEVTAQWIEPVIDLMESDTLIAACQPKILSYIDRDRFEYAGASGGWIDNFGYPFTRGRVFDSCEKDEGQYDDAQPCFWASGAALFIRAELFHKANGFDEYFFAHQEEIDLCWRLQRAGYKIFVQPASVVYHVGGGTLPQGNSRKTFLNFRNNMIMMHKNLRFSSAVWKLPVRIVLNAVVAVKSLGSSPGDFLAIAKAHRHYLLWILKRPKQQGKLDSYPTMSGWYKGSVVLDYFVHGRKTFSEIVKGK